MATKIEVNLFLAEFKEKMKIWNVLFIDDRSKNAQTLLDLELKPNDRVNVLQKLSLEDYSQGPIINNDNGPNLWVFGKVVKSYEIYIKITIGFVRTSVVCISFHIAEHTMLYPFKTV